MLICTLARGLALTQRGAARRMYPAGRVQQDVIGEQPGVPRCRIDDIAFLARSLVMTPSKPRNVFMLR
jgi:hypothetical protein